MGNVFEWLFNRCHSTWSSSVCVGKRRIGMVSLREGGTGFGLTYVRTFHSIPSPDGCSISTLFVCFGERGRRGAYE